MSAHHGNTPAAWTGALIVLVGFVVGGLGLALDVWMMFWVGVGCLALGGIVGLVMAKMGYGADVPVHR
jgi:hypothetical protein